MKPDGTESDPEFKGYHNGNTDPVGWAHIGLTVDDLPSAVARFKDLQQPLLKDLTDVNPYNPEERHPNFGKYVFIADPDGYWIK